MYDTSLPGAASSTVDGFDDFLRRVERTGRARSDRGLTRELAFDEELRFDERRTRRRRSPRPEARGLPNAADLSKAKPKPRPTLRLVPPAVVDETVAVDDAQVHARMQSCSWKQYVKNLDAFLAQQLDDATAMGKTG